MGVSLVKDTIVNGQRVSMITSQKLNISMEPTTLNVQEGITSEVVNLATTSHNSTPQSHSVEKPVKSLAQDDALNFQDDYEPQ